MIIASLQISFLIFSMFQDKGNMYSHYTNSLLPHLHILHFLRQTAGRLKLQDKGNIIFKNSKTGIVENLLPSDILTAQWLQRSRGYCLRFKGDNDHIYRYDGFAESVSVVVVMAPPYITDSHLPFSTLGLCETVIVP